MSHDPAGAIELRRGAPGLLAAAVIPVVATGLVVLGWSRDAAGGDPVGPGTVAVLTALGAAVLAWRAVTQRAELRDDELWCRNLTVSFAVEWDRVVELRVVRRAPVVIVEVVVADLRRRHRLGAATRFSSDEEGIEELLATLRAHRRAGALVEIESS